MASEDVLSSVILRLFYRAHSESLPDIMYENIAQNRVSTYFVRDQNRLLVPRYDTRYMEDSLLFRGASLWNFVNYNDKEASATLNFNNNNNNNNNNNSLYSIKE